MRIIFLSSREPGEFCEQRNAIIALQFRKHFGSIEAGLIGGNESEIRADRSAIMYKEIHLRWWMWQNILQNLFFFLLWLIELLIFNWTYGSERLNIPASLTVRCDLVTKFWQIGYK